MSEATNGKQVAIAGWRVVTRTQPFHGVTFDGQRFDCGSKAGYIEANFALALERDDIGAHIREFARKLVG